jgi:hypothetical protein
MHISKLTYKCMKHENMKLINIKNDIDQFLMQFQSFKIY